MNTRSIYRCFLNISAKLLGAAVTKKLDARIRFHRKLDLKNPHTLADKLCYLELYNESTLKIKCTDKYEVRSYVEEKGLADLLVPLYGGPYSDIREIDFESLPSRFAIKATHGCGMNLICEDKEGLDIDKAKKLVDKWLHEDYSRACIEPHYKKIQRRVIIEKFLQDADRIIDYKFHCFHGVPDFILTCRNRVSGLQRGLYTLDWEPIDELAVSEAGKCSFERPDDLQRMIEISKILSADFEFVRVDLYDINGKIYFGELTFTPASGVLPSFSDRFIEEKGKLLKMESQ